MPNAPMIALYATLTTLLLVGIGEWLHARRCRRVGALAFGPRGRPRGWVSAVPWVRALCAGALVWGFVTLLQLGPRVVRQEDRLPEGGYRHLLLALDVSPSMRLTDAGPAGEETRARRAGEVLSSLIRRIATDQVRISIVAFYTGAKAVVIDTYDLDVVENCLNDLPLDIAFDVGKTELLEGVRQSVALAKPWQPDSTTLVIASDGDTIPDTGMPGLPKSIARTLVVGVGDPRAGRFIDGHQSRQDVSTLRQLAGRLRGEYFDANRKHLPSDLLTGLSGALPLRDTTHRGRREVALACIGVGSFTLAIVPVALALAGSSWHAGRRSQSSGRRRNRAVADTASNHESEKLTYA